MQAYTQHMPAIPVRISRADPWPSYTEAMDTARAAFAATLRPARFGALASDWHHYAKPGLYCRLSDEKLLVRRQGDSALLPAWNVYDTPRRVPRKRGRFERFLDKLILWRQGWRKADRVVVSSGKSHPLFR